MIAQQWDLAMTHSIAALAVFDAGKAERDHMADTAATVEAIRAWEQAEDDAADAVRRAFYEDTKDRNSLDTIMACRIGIDFVRRCCDCARRAGLA